ncbi:hypothetical protein [Gemmatimonas sp.]|uniref:hypothetical protein n=1 Tax=Gemmatimonas sp. TaxID=1962908 RepID=UPI0037BF8671
MIPLGLGAAAVLSVLAAPVRAQGAAVRADIPRFSIHTPAASRPVAQRPGFSLRVDQDAYVTVLVVARGQVNFPLQVLSPSRPGAEGRLLAGRDVPVRQLGERELLHLMHHVEAPVVVAFASSMKPDLSRFAQGKRWGSDLQIDSAAVDPRDMVDLLGLLLFGRDGTYDVVVRPAGDVVVRPAGSVAGQTYAADPFTFFDECRGFANQWTNLSGRDGGFYRPWNEIEPLERGLVNPVSYRPMTSNWMLGEAPIVPSRNRQDVMPSLQLGGGVCTGIRVGGFPPRPTPAAAPGTPTIPVPPTNTERAGSADPAVDSSGVTGETPVPQRSRKLPD